jgi:hypothetical protein
MPTNTVTPIRSNILQAPLRAFNWAAFLALAALVNGASAMPKASDAVDSAASGYVDSTALRDPFLAPPPGTVPDTGAKAPPSERQEAVKLSAQGAFTNTSPKVGDSLDYVLQVEWQDTQVPVIVLAPDSLSFQGFKILGQATVHKKLASARDVRNHTEFIYRLRAQTQGSGRATSLKVRYLTGLSRQEEAIFVPTALIDILPAPVHIMDMLWFKLLAGLILLGGAATLGMASFKFASRKRKTSEPAKPDLRPDVNALKARLRSSAINTPEASKAVLLAMEDLCIRFLRMETKADASQARFEPLLDTYLAGNGANGGTAVQELQDWNKLRELFRHARFAGGHKEPHELQDAFKTFKRCLKITGEDEHE